MASGKRKPRKRAVLMANQKYRYIGGLETPVAEAKSFAGALKSRGYKTKQRNNRTAKSMESGWGSMISSAKKGDQLVAYYAGHGAEDGLVGVKYGGPKDSSDLVSYGSVSSMISQATGKGANIRFIMDSCHSGTGTQLVRSAQIGKLAAEGKGITAKVVSLVLGLLQQERSKLMDHVHNREAKLEEADDAIRDHQTIAPEADASDQEWDDWEAQKAVLDQAKVDLETQLDGQARAMWASMRGGMAFVARFADLAAPPREHHRSSHLRRTAQVGGSALQPPAQVGPGHRGRGS